MRVHGITYDTGFFHAGLDTHPGFNPERVRRDLLAIRDRLHCEAVRVWGGDPDRLETTATIAAELGLEVWIGPFSCDIPQPQLLELFADLAQRAERLRLTGAEVVLCTGAELSLVAPGFLPGDTIDDRMALLADPAQLRPAISAVPALINAFLAEAVAVVRARFGGRISYAAIPFEGVDWTPFDLVSVDAYRSAEVAHVFADSIKALVAQGKPVAITECGCAGFTGAADLGARGGDILDWTDPTTPTLSGHYHRDEAEQAEYLRELLSIFRQTGVDSTFVHTFASYHLPHRADPAEDLDLAGYGVVAVDETGSWRPKAAFTAVAECHRR
jgi:hypothetical protein